MTRLPGGPEGTQGGDDGAGQCASAAEGLELLSESSELLLEVLFASGLALLPRLQSWLALTQQENLLTVTRESPLCFQQ